MGFTAGGPPPKKSGRKINKRKITPDLPLPKRNPLNEQLGARNPDGSKVITKDIEKDDRAETSSVLNLLKTQSDVIKRTTGNGYWGAIVFPDEATYQMFMAQT